MKFKSILLLLLSSLLLIPAAIAPTAVEFGAPGTTPDSFWYPVERWWERTFETNVDHTPERFAEMQAMLTAGKTEAASRAGEEVRQTITFVQDQIEGASLDEILGQQERLYTYERYFQELKNEETEFQLLDDDVERLEGSEEFTDESSKQLERGEVGGEVFQVFQSVDNALTETGTLIEIREGEIAHEITAEQGISFLEAEEQVEQAERERFGEELAKRITTESLEQLQAQLQEARTKFAEAAAEGQEIPNAQALGTLLEKATEKVLQAEAAFDAGQTGRADGLSTAAKHLISNADRFLDEEVDEKEERVVELATHIQEQDEARTQRLVEVVEQGNLLDSFPPEQRIQMEQAWKTHTLALQRQEFQEEKRAQLSEEGKSNEEIARTLMEDFANEYELIYGDKYYLPPVATEPEVADERFFLVLAEEAAERLRETEGVVEGVVYTDPYTQYDYTFSDDGYTFTTPLGIEHEVESPEIKEALQQAENPFETGTEVVSKVVETPEGPVEYRYTATGHEVRLPDGTTEKKSYDVGKHKLPGGGLVEIKPYGFELVRVGGERKIYDYHPEYNNFVSTDGYVYMPPEGTAVHHEMRYDYEKGNFKFERPDSIWRYDAANKNWQEERAEVGRTVRYEGKTYTVTEEKGWTDEEGNAVPPPPGQPSSETGGPVSGRETYQLRTQPFAPVGTTFTVVQEGKTYVVDAVLGWSLDGKAVPPPVGQPSSAVGASGGFARVGTTATIDGKKYVVDPAKGWMDVETGKAVPPPRGYQSSAVGMRLGEFGIGVEKNYNFVDKKGKAYLFPPDINPETVDKSQYEQYLVKEPRGYDRAFGTDFGGSGPGYTAYSTTTYGHIKDGTTGIWRPATKDEADQAQKEGKGGGENPTYSPAGFYGTAVRNYNFVEEGKAYYFPPGVDPGKVNAEYKSQYLVGDPRGYDPAYNTYFGGQTGGVGTPSYSAGDTSYTSSTSYGHVRDVATGTWRPATAEEAAKGGSDYSAPGSTATSGYTGSAYSGGYDPAAAAAGWPGGAYPGGVAPYSGPYVGPVESGSYSGGTYSGGTYSGGTPAGSSYTGGTYSGGAYSGGTYGGTPSSGGYTGGTYSGGYTGGEGGSYGGSTGSSYGGDTGGSTGGSTGGDTGGSTGGSTDGSTGGDTGSSMSSSTGGIVAESSEQESSWSPITQWIYNYLGLKR